MDGGKRLVNSKRMERLGKPSDRQHTQGRMKDVTDLLEYEVAIGALM